MPPKINNKQDKKSYGIWNDFWTDFGAILTPFGRPWDLILAQKGEIWRATLCPFAVLSLNWSTFRPGSQLCSHLVSMLGPLGSHFRNFVGYVGSICSPFGLFLSMLGYFWSPWITFDLF